MSLLRACAVLQALRLLLEVLLTAVKYGRRARGSTSGWDGASGSGAGAGTAGNGMQMRGRSVFPGSPDGLDLILDLEGLKAGPGCWGTDPEHFPGRQGGGLHWLFRYLMAQHSLNREVLRGEISTT